MAVDGSVAVAVEVLLLSGKSVLLAGAPGTGKTRLSMDASERFTGMLPVVVVGRGDMASRELLYSYEPEGHTLRLVLGPLAVSVLASWARLVNGLSPLWMLLDELNRMNAETVLGGLFTALDLAHRGRVKVVDKWLVERVLGDERLLAEVADHAGLAPGDIKSGLREALARARERGLAGLPLPYSWRALATVNMVDRAHLFRLGFALLRRFPLVPVPGLGERLEARLDTGELERLAGTAKARLEAMLRAVRELCAEAVGELALRGLVVTDVPLYAVGLGEELAARAAEEYSDALRAATLVASKMREAGIETGPAFLADTCRVAVAAYLRGGVDPGTVADIAVGSLLLPQLGAAAPAVKTEVLLGAEPRRARRVKHVLAAARRILGDESIAARYAEALSLELPLAAV